MTEFGIGSRADQPLRIAWIVELGKEQGSTVTNEIWLGVLHVERDKARR